MPTFAFELGAKFGTDGGWVRQKLGEQFAEWLVADELHGRLAVGGALLKIDKPATGEVGLGNLEVAILADHHKWGDSSTRGLVNVRTLVAEEVIHNVGTIPVGGPEEASTALLVRNIEINSRVLHQQPGDIQLAKVARLVKGSPHSALMSGVQVNIRVITQELLNSLKVPVARGRVNQLVRISHGQRRMKKSEEEEEEEEEEEPRERLVHERGKKGQSVQQDHLGSNNIWKINGARISGCWDQMSRSGGQTLKGNPEEKGSSS